MLTFICTKRNEDKIPIFTYQISKKTEIEYNSVHKATGSGTQFLVRVQILTNLMQGNLEIPIGRKTNTHFTHVRPHSQSNFCSTLSHSKKLETALYSSIVDKLNKSWCVLYNKIQLKIKLKSLFYRLIWKYLLGILSKDARNRTVYIECYIFWGVTGKEEK